MVFARSCECVVVLAILTACQVCGGTASSDEHLHSQLNEKARRLDSIVVSLTTVPDRLEKLGPTLESLLTQTRKVQIVVAVPYVSKRFPDQQYSIPPWLASMDGVIVIRCPDYGPATKLLWALEHMEDNGIIVTVDDDSLYHPQMVENLLAYAEQFPDAALAHAGHQLFGPPIKMQNFESVHFLRSPHHQRFYGLSVSEPLQADVLHGYAAALYRRRFLDEGFTDYESLGAAGAAAFFVDDDWISCHLARKGVEIMVVPSPEPLLARMAEVQGSALNEGEEKMRAQMRAQTLLLAACVEEGWLALRPAHTKPPRPAPSAPAELQRWAERCPPRALSAARASSRPSAALQRFRRQTQGGGADGEGEAGEVRILEPVSGSVLSCAAAVQAWTVRVRVQLPPESAAEEVEVRAGSLRVYGASFRWFRSEHGPEALFRVPLRDAGEQVRLAGNAVTEVRVEVLVAGEVRDSAEVLVEVQGAQFLGASGLLPNAQARCDRWYATLAPSARSDWFLPDEGGLYAAEEGAGGVLEVLEALASDAAGGGEGGEGGGGEARRVVMLGGGQVHRALEMRGWVSETVGGDGAAGGGEEWGRGERKAADVVWVEARGLEFQAWARAGRGVEAAVVAVRFNPLLPADEDWVATRAYDGELEGWEGSVYTGASLLALVRLGGWLGYQLVHVGQRGGLAYFVREEAVGEVLRRRGAAGRGGLEEMLGMARLVECLDGDPRAYRWADSRQLLLQLEREDQQRRASARLDACPAGHRTEPT